MFGRRARRWWGGGISILALLWVLANPALAADPHTGCVDCHADSASGSLLEAEPKLCLECHVQRMGAAEHSIGMTLTEPPAEVLPLPGGVVNCSTCHDPHSEAPGQLRLAGDRLCDACHRK